MTPDEIIEVLQGVKAGRKWGKRIPIDNILVENNDQRFGNLIVCVAHGEHVELMPLPDELTIPARVIPAPLRGAPKDGTMVYWPDPLYEAHADGAVWRDGNRENVLMLERGLLFDTPEKAVQVGKAMCPYA